MRVGSTSSALSTPVSQSERVQQAPSTQADSSQQAQESKQAASKNDKLDISNASGQLNKSAAASQETQFRADKVAEIKKSIENNDYQVNSRAVAEKMLFAFSRGPTA